MINVNDFKTLTDSDTIENAIKKGEITMAGLNERVKKVPKKLYHFTLDTNLESIFNSRI